MDHAETGGARKGGGRLKRWASEHVGRKYRWCAACGEMIFEGRIYVAYRGVEDGRFLATALHPHCFRGNIDHPAPKTQTVLAAEARLFNERFPVGTPVVYFPIAGVMDFRRTKVRSEAWAIPSGSVLVKVDGVAGGVAIGHVKAESEVSAC